MTSSLEASEALAAEGATAPRISLEDIYSEIAQCYYITGDRVAGHANHIDYETRAVRKAELGVFTICMMVLSSGFIVVGRSSPISPENFDESKGRTFAYEECIRQLWPLFAFAAKQGRISP